VLSDLVSFDVIHMFKTTSSRGCLAGCNQTSLLPRVQWLAYSA